MNAFYHETFKMKMQQPIQVILHQGESEFIVSEHWHRTVELNYLIDCNALYWINGEQIWGKAGSIVLINSRDVHCILPEDRNQKIGEGLHGVSLFISYDFLKEICPDIDNISFCLEGAPEKQKILKELFHDLIKLYGEEEEEYSYLLLNSILDQILYQLFTYFKKEKPNVVQKSQKYFDRIRNVMEYMEQHYAEPISLQSVAKEYSVSLEYLAKVFKNYTGKTFKEYLNQLRLEKAFQEVIETDYSMLDIAMRNGFPDVRAFDTIFRKAYGMTPFRYKKYYAETGRTGKEKPFDNRPHILAYREEEQT